MVNLLDFLSQFDSTVLVIIILTILILEVFILSFPKEIVLIFAGFVFGTFIGGIINIIGLFGNHAFMQKYQEWLGKNGLKALVICRLFPLTPNDILSISCGFSRLKRIPYLIITFLAAIPYAFFFAYIGSREINRWVELFPESFDPSKLLFWFVVIILIGWLIVDTGTIRDQPAEVLSHRYTPYKPL
ncbi:MAG: VTT domain-containing protein [Candidatus Kariarchaeaceae archaeon]|jgi:uncharacterized membrane protein YdjX (TVP38/TMEM64 family)